MLDVTGFNEYNIKLDSVIGNDTGHIQNRGGAIGRIVPVVEKHFLGQRVIACDVSWYKVYQRRQGHACKIEVGKSRANSSVAAMPLTGYFITV